MSSHARPGQAVRLAFRRYRECHLEESALRVVARGLFLALVLMVAFLYVFTAATSLIAGQNEILIPTTRLDPSIDLGVIVRGAFTRTSSSVLSVVGVLTLIISSILTARALRVGTRRALLGANADPVSWRDARTLAVAAAISLLVLGTWLLTLATSIRRAAWNTLLGTDISELGIDGAKVGVILLQLAIIASAAITAYRLVVGRWPARGAIGILTLMAAIVVGLNYFLLYTYVGALINPQVSAGVVLVFTLLLWANLVVRAYLGSLCLIDVTGSRDGA